MINANGSRENAGFNFYGPQYSRFESLIAAEIRREVYVEDIGQQGWRTASEQAEIADLVNRGSEIKVLDIGCGAGGPSLALSSVSAVGLPASMSRQPVSPTPQPRLQLGACLTWPPSRSRTAMND